MRTIVLDDFQLALIQTALGEMAWANKNTQAGNNYKELSKIIKQQIKEQ